MSNDYKTARDAKAANKFHLDNIHARDYVYGFKDGADFGRKYGRDEILNSPEIKALAYALDAMIKAAADNNCGLRIADEALAAFKKLTEHDSQSVSDAEKK